jgi:hypothetical protein
MNDTKSLFKSKTFWFNVLSTLGTLLGVAAGVVAAPAQPYVMAANGIVNVGLRLVTNQPVSVTGGQ